MTRFIADYSATPMARHIPIPVRPQAMTPGRVLTMAELARIESAAMRLKRPLTPEEMVAEARPKTAEQIAEERRAKKAEGQRERRQGERITRAERKAEVANLMREAGHDVTVELIACSMGLNDGYVRKLLEGLCADGVANKRRSNGNQPWIYSLAQAELGA